jgi:hypothetical protein
VLVKNEDSRNVFKMLASIPVANRYTALVKRGDTLSSMQFTNTCQALSAIVYMVTLTGGDDVGADVLEVGSWSRSSWSRS